MIYETWLVGLYAEQSYRRKVELLKRNGCVIIASPSNVRWLVGTEGGIVLIDETKEVMVAPKLELDRIRKSVEWIEVIEGPRGSLWKKVRDLCSGPYYADLAYLNYSQANSLVSEFKAKDVSKEIARLRRSKDEYELKTIKSALKIAEDAFKITWEELREGITELQAAGILEMRMRELGAQEYAFNTISAFGENSAEPHHIPSARKWGLNEIALFDFGAVVNGFRSDITRTFAPDRRSEWMIAVLEAVNESMKAVREGVRASDIDAIARNVLKEYGYEKAFIHGLGHGVGADIHEPPYLSPSSNDVLVEGDVVTIEPGIYFQGEGGIRVEQMVVVKRNGWEVLNELPALWY